MILLWKKILSVEKLHLTWNKLTDFNKLGPLPRVLQIMLRSRGVENLPGDFSIGWWESDKDWFWLLEPFLKLKTTFCKYWKLIKIKISMTCMCKEYDEGKMKMVQEHWIQLKWSLYWVVTWKLLFRGGGGCTVGGGNKNFGMSLLGGLFLVW